MRWDPLEFARAVPDQAELQASEMLIELWRERALAMFPDPEDEGSRLGIVLQAHLRHTISAFTLSQRPEIGGLVANAALTALGHCAGLILAEGEARGFPRAHGLDVLLGRINAVIDDELEHDGKKHAG